MLLRNLPKTWDTSTSIGEWLNETKERYAWGEGGGTCTLTQTHKTAFTVAPLQALTNVLARFTTDKSVNKSLRLHICAVK